MVSRFIQFIFYRLTAALLLGYLTVLGVFAQQDSLSLQRTIQAVLQGHPLIEQGKLTAQAAQARVGQRKASRFPIVAGDASFTRVDPVSKVAFPTVVGVDASQLRTLPGGTQGYSSVFSGGAPLQFQPNNLFDGHIGASYTLWDFGTREKNVQLAESQVVSSQRTVEVTERDLAYQAVQVFYGILYLKRGIAVQDSQLKSLGIALENNRKRVSNGTATEYDVLTTQVQVATAQNLRTDLENNLRTQEILLRRMMGLDDAAALPLTGSFEYVPFRLAVDSVLQQGMSNRVELRQARDAEFTANLQRDLASKAHLPTLSANVNAGGKNAYLPNIYAIRGNWAASVALHVPIFTGKLYTYQRQEADASYRATLSRTADVERQINADVLTAYANLKSNEEKYITSETQVKQARDAVVRARARYANQVITNLDLIQSTVAQANAELNYLQALYSYVLSTYALKRAAGEKIW